MAIVTLAQQKAHNHIEFTDDDAQIAAQIEAAQAHIEQLLGYNIASQFPVDSPPADLVGAVLMQASHLYEHRLSTVAGFAMVETPMGVWDVVRERRLYSF